jgi:hypothetical protein
MVTYGAAGEWELPNWMHEAFGEGTRRIVLVPIPGRGDGQALRGLQSQRMNVGQEYQKSRKLLAAGGNAEFGRLLDGPSSAAAKLQLGRSCLE